MVRFTDVEPTPDAFAAVMATGVVSVAAHNHEYRWISDTLGVIATCGLVCLVALVTAAAAARGFALWDLRDPDVTLRAFTFVAACAVLDSRLDSHPVVWVLGVVALACWLALMVLSARSMLAYSWSALRDRACGAWELASVGSCGLVIVATKVGRYTADRWWLGLAVPVWIAALCIYLLMTWLVLWRTVAERQDRDGLAPDSWILMGGMAIATLAGDGIHTMAPALLAGPVRVVTVVTWVTATLWIPPLIYFSLHRISQRPGTLHFADVWWAFVFPLGTYSVAAHSMAAEIGQRSLRTVSLVFFWDALAAWLVVVVAGALLVGRAMLASANRNTGRP